MSDPEFAEAWADLDEKTLLASILAEQQRTNQLLADLAGETPDTSTEATPLYVCRYCSAEVRKDERQRHAEGEHNVPPETWQNAFDVSD